MNQPFCNAVAFRSVTIAVLTALAMSACGYGDRAEATDAAVPVQASANTGDTTADPNDAVSTDATPEAPSLQAAISGLRQPRPGLYTAGQPENTAWQAAAEDGVTTVINLRPAAEMGERDEATEVAAAGMAYHQLPVAGASDISMANAIELRRLIDEAPGPVLVHCASGNRVGALLALGELESGVDAEQAVAFGRSAGLASLEPRVREVIETTRAETCEPDANC
ncbi:hypothetical protein INQ40_03245 [Lysobacter sp. H21R4]|uniref:beta-lactamase hydrolase domain-containing protein n=1 Tax=Lysobacter sp. H21R4 TaxID=2781021 RepID=UPI001889A025|nr:sulfur transferase domain-containing protein [Lysobacter sp. H21R4]QOY63292.1 hypothetical protein INQ40_03245 [Lysobacter sp. H21R4]